MKTAVTCTTKKKLHLKILFGCYKINEWKGMEWKVTPFGSDTPLAS